MGFPRSLLKAAVQLGASPLSLTLAGFLTAAVLEGVLVVKCLKLGLR